MFDRIQIFVSPNFRITKKNASFVLILIYSETSAQLFFFFLFATTKTILHRLLSHGYSAGLSHKCPHFEVRERKINTKVPGRESLTYDVCRWMYSKCDKIRTRLKGLFTESEFVEKYSKQGLGNGRDELKLNSLKQVQPASRKPENMSYKPQNQWLARAECIPRLGFWMSPRCT